MLGVGNRYGGSTALIINFTRYIVLKIKKYFLPTKHAGNISRNFLPHEVKNPALAWYFVAYLLDVQKINGSPTLHTYACFY